MLLTKQIHTITNENQAWGGSIVGVCINNDHPTLVGRCLVHWSDGETGHEQWLPCLDQVEPQIHDRLLLLKPDNASEAIVVGVIDGLQKKTESDPVPGPSVQLDKNEALHVLSSDGVPLLEVRQGEKGPILRLLNDDLDLEVPGELRIKAKSIAMSAQRGEVKIEATDDVIVKGEVIKLN